MLSGSSVILLKSSAALCGSFSFFLRLRIRIFLLHKCVVKFNVLCICRLHIQKDFMRKIRGVFFVSFSGRITYSLANAFEKDFHRKVMNFVYQGLFFLMYLFIYLRLCWVFVALQGAGATPHCSMRASCCRALALEHRLSSYGAQA